MRSRIQGTVAGLLGRRLAKGDPGRVLVLCYHSVHPAKDFSTRPEQFERHLEWIRSHCDVISFVGALEEAGAARTRPAVAITFDDGYEDNYRHAFPALARHGCTATFFLTAGLLERDPEVIERFRQIQQTGAEQLQPLEWGQAKEMRRAGMELGAHTYSHPNLARLRPAQLRGELTLSKEILEQRLGEAIHSVAYPYGIPRRSVNRAVTEAAAEAGFRHGASVVFRPVQPSDDPLAIPRFSIYHDSAEVLRQKISGWWDYLGWWQETAPVWVASLVAGRSVVNLGR